MREPFFRRETRVSLGRPYRGKPKAVLPLRLCPEES